MEVIDVEGVARYPSRATSFNLTAEEMQEILFLSCAEGTMLLNPGSASSCI